MSTRSHDSEVLLFSAPHCSSCRAVRPVASELASTFDGSVIFREIDAAAERAVVLRHGVKGVPTFVALRDDVEVGRLVGVGTHNDLERLFSAAISGDTIGRGISTTDRVLRLAVAAAFAGAALATGVISLWLLAVGTAAFASWDLIRPQRRS